MLSPDQAMAVLRQIAYQRVNVRPSKKSPAYMPIYFSGQIRESRAYGRNGRVYGYIAPARYQRNKRYIRELIGYHKAIFLEESK